MKGGFCNAGATWVGEAENFGNLVEALANGIVPRGTNNIELIVPWHVKNLGVAA